MKIAAIIDRKGRTFETVSETASLADAVDVMHRRSIGSVGVRQDRTGGILGIISQHELTAALARHGQHALKAPVGAFMRHPAPSCDCQDNAADVMRVMTRERCRHAVVRGPGGHIAGLVSLGDLVAALLEQSQLEASVLRDMARSHLLAVPG